MRADVEDSLGITGDSAYSETLIIDLVPFTLSTDTVDWVISSDAAALSIGKHLVGSTSDNTESSLISVSIRASTCLFLSVVGSVSWALLAGSIDHVERSSASAGATNAVVDLVGLACDSADLKGDVEESTSCADLANSVDHVIALDADANLVYKGLVRSALTGWNGKRLSWNWSTSGRNAVSIVKSVALDAVTGLCLGIVSSISLASSTLSVDIEET